MSKNSDQVILQLYARTPAPCRDYCGLTITNEDVTLNVWNITFGPHVYPKRFKCSLENLTENKYIQSEISRVFGEHVVEYARSLSNNELRLENLSTKAFLSILKYVAAKDILSLSQTSKILFERCNDDKIWSLMFRKLFKKSPSRSEFLHVEEIGWKKLILDKLSFNPYYRFKKKFEVADSKSVPDGKIVNNKFQKNVVKSEIRLIPRNNLTRNTASSNINLANSKSSTRTLLQVKNDLKINNSNCTKLKPTVQVPKNTKNNLSSVSNLTLPKKTDNKSVEKKPLPIKVIKKPPERSTEKKPILKKIDSKLVNAKSEKKPTEKKVVKREVEKKLKKLN